MKAVHHLEPFVRLAVVVYLNGKNHLTYPLPIPIIRKFYSAVLQIVENGSLIRSTLMKYVR